MPFTESIVAGATLNWFRELDYALLHGQEIAPGEAALERTSFRGLGISVDGREAHA